VQGRRSGEIITGITEEEEEEGGELDDEEVEEVDHFGPELVLPGNRIDIYEDGDGNGVPTSPASLLAEEPPKSPHSNAPSAGVGEGKKVPLTAAALAKMEEEEEAKEEVDALA